MKKLLLVLIFALPLISFSQTTLYDGFPVSMGLGATVTRLDVGDASPVGLYMDLDINKFHIDFSSNFASGEGEYLVYSSSETRKANKQLWYAINAGYVVFQQGNFSIIPKAGIILLRDIYEDPIAFDSYYDESAGTEFQVGVDIRYRIDSWYIKVGCSTTEIFSCGAGLIF